MVQVSPNYFEIRTKIQTQISQPFLGEVDSDFGVHDLRHMYNLHLKHTHPNSPQFQMHQAEQQRLSQQSFKPQPQGRMNNGLAGGADQQQRANYQPQRFGPNTYVAVENAKQARIDKMLFEQSKRREYDTLLKLLQLCVSEISQNVQHVNETDIFSDNDQTLHELGENVKQLRSIKQKMRTLKNEPIGLTAENFKILERCIAQVDPIDSSTLLLIRTYIQKSLPKLDSIKVQIQELVAKFNAVFITENRASNQAH